MRHDRAKGGTSRRGTFGAAGTEGHIRDRARVRLSLPPHLEGVVVGLKCSVLAVDDEPQMLAMLTALLGDHFEVVTATCAVEARDVLGTRDIDIVLTDQYLPDNTPDPETGVQLLEWVWRRRPAT